MNWIGVSILVLMDLCIKTFLMAFWANWLFGFNPCLNGSMYKNRLCKRSYFGNL